MPVISIMTWLMPCCSQCSIGCYRPPLSIQFCLVLQLPSSAVPQPGFHLSFYTSPCQVFLAHPLHLQPCTVTVVLARQCSWHFFALAVKGLANRNNLFNSNHYLLYFTLLARREVTRISYDMKNTTTVHHHWHHIIINTHTCMPEFSLVIKRDRKVSQQ